MHLHEDFPGEFDGGDADLEGVVLDVVLLFVRVGVLVFAPALVRLVFHVVLVVVLFILVRIEFHELL